MAVPTVSQTKTWNPDVLSGQADEWRTLGDAINQQVDAFSRSVDSTKAHWGGKAADKARDTATDIETMARQTAKAVMAASDAAQAGTGQISAARDVVVAAVTDAETAQFVVADDGSVTISPTLFQTAVLALGGNMITAMIVLQGKAKQHESSIKSALTVLGAADDNVTAAIDTAFGSLPGGTGAGGETAIRPQSSSDPWPSRAITGASAGLGAASHRIADQVVPSGAHAAVTGSAAERAVAKDALKTVGHASFVGGMVADGFGGYSDWKDGKSSAGEATVGALGSFGGGAAGGALAGAAVGSFLGPVGTGVGAGVGAIIGSEVGKKAAEGLWHAFGGD